MSIITLLSGLLSGGGLGAVTGVIGGAVTRYFDLKNTAAQTAKSAQDNAHELAMKQLDIDTMKAEATSNFKVEELKAQSLSSAQDVDLLKAGYNFEPQMYADKAHITTGQNWLFTILDVIRALVRPCLTAYLAVFMTLIFWQSLKILNREGVTIDPDDAYALVQQCVTVVVTSFTFTMSFYFSTRNKASEAKARSGK